MRAAKVKSVGRKNEGESAIKEIPMAKVRRRVNIGHEFVFIHNSRQPFSTLFCACASASASQWKLPQASGARPNW